MATDADRRAPRDSAQKRMTAVTIRPGVSDDRERVWPLAQDFATSFRPARDAFDVSFGALVEDDGVLLLVAEDGDEVGYLVAHCHITFLANGPVAFVDEVMVERSRRREGVGESLMAAAEEWSTGKGAAYIALATRRAAPFYAALGYEESATYFRKTGI